MRNFLQDDAAQVLTVKQAAHLLTVHPITLRRMRHADGGPPWLQISPKRIGYRRSDLVEWQLQRLSRAPPIRRHESTVQHRRPAAEGAAA
jgi:hypothetical protein